MNEEYFISKQTVMTSMGCEIDQLRKENAALKKQVEEYEQIRSGNIELIIKNNGLMNIIESERQRFQALTLELKEYKESLEWLCNKELSLECHGKGHWLVWNNAEGVIVGEDAHEVYGDSPLEAIKAAKNAVTKE